MLKPWYQLPYLKLHVLVGLAVFNSGCHLGYLIKNGYYEMDLLNQRRSIEDVLKDEKLAPEIREKLLLSQEAKIFAENEIGLVKTKNYKTYVALDRDYVTYAVTASPKNKLEAYLWKFPIVGAVPYKGFFNKNDAINEGEELKKQELDVYVRGVTAFSSLGWFNDPLLSSMMRMGKYDLVEVIIHETVHATLYIKSAADFNERLATFIGEKGAEQFFKAKEGENSQALAEAKLEAADTKIFSEFISAEIKELKLWYSKQLAPIDEKARHARLEQLKSRFSEQLLPQLKTPSYKRFGEQTLNNALLLGYETYYTDLSDYQKVFDKMGQNLKSFVQKCKELEHVEKPLETLKQWGS